MKFETQIHGQEVQSEINNSTFFKNDTLQLSEYACD